jgi:hypothetical protein
MVYRQSAKPESEVRPERPKLGLFGKAFGG